MFLRIPGKAVAAVVEGAVAVIVLRVAAIVEVTPEGMLVRLEAIVEVEYNVRPVVGVINSGNEPQRMRGGQLASSYSL